MLNNNHNHAECSYGEQLVSYLYNEIEAAERTAFETHLADCASCADDLAAFTGVHFSIGEWKEQEFVNLNLPLIEIPYETNKSRPETFVVSSSKGMWLDGLRSLFSFNSAWSTAGAAFAFLVIFSGFAFIVLNSGSDKDNQNMALSQTVSPTVENFNSNKNIAPVPKQTEIKAPNQPDLVVGQPPNTQNKPIKINEKSRPTPKTENNNTNVQKNNETKNKKNIDSRQKAPSLSPYEEEEDDSLRLSDLFSEIDAD